ncbi:unnamed protein product [Polarella glacialis]|uniref:EF-hand domain-containing protein n=1 Tax=Polarella glacialis TaxID=89957 RepID=A0A813LAW4_POLGL|nr:unnamed protein product [Polarella glacialis]
MALVQPAGRFLAPPSPSSGSQPGRPGSPSSVLQPGRQRLLQQLDQTSAVPHAVRMRSGLVELNHESVTFASAPDAQRSAEPKSLARFPATAYNADWQLKPSFSLPDLSSSKRPNSRGCNFAGSHQRLGQGVKSELIMIWKRPSSQPNSRPSSTQPNPLTRGPWWSERPSKGSTATSEERTWSPSKPNGISPKAKKVSAAPELKVLDPSSFSHSEDLGRAKDLGHFSEPPAELPVRQVPQVRHESKSPAVSERPQLLSTYAHAQSVPLDIAKQYADLPDELEETDITESSISQGKPFRVSELGSMSVQSFGKALLHICTCKTFEELPEGFLSTAVTSCDTDHSGNIDVREFMHFYFKFSFTEEANSTPDERERRLLARNSGISYTEVEKYRVQFQIVDDDGSGQIEYPEFATLVKKLTKLPKGQEIPDGRMRKLWVDANPQRLEGLDFSAFVLFCSTFFVDGQDPLQSFYSNAAKRKSKAPSKEQRYAPLI